MSRQKQASTRAEPQPLTFLECFERLRREIQIKNLAGLGIAGERRNAFLAALAGEGVNGYELLLINAGRCAPPLLEAEVQQILEVERREVAYRLRLAEPPEVATI
jgi:hypothetical protein